MKAKSCQLIRGNVRTKGPSLRALCNNLRQEPDEVLMSLPCMSSLMQTRRIHFVVTGLGQESISVQNRFKLLTGSNSLSFDANQLVQMRLNLTLMPRQQDGLDIRKVLVQGRPTNPRPLGDRRHRHP